MGGSKDGVKGWAVGSYEIGLNYNVDDWWRVTKQVDQLIWHIATV